MNSGTIHRAAAASTACVLFLMGAAGPVRGETLPTINVPHTGQLLGSTGEHPNAYAYRGQTFEALANRIDSMRFRLRMNTPQSDPDGPVHWRVLVTETTGAGTSTRPSTVLFESDRFTYSSLAVTDFDLDLGGLPVVVDQTYAWLIDTYVEWDGVLDGLDLAIDFNGSYADGHIIYAVNNVGSTATRAQHFAGNWHDSFNYDLTFAMTFIPEPAAAAVVGLAGLLLWWRRWRLD